MRLRELTGGMMLMVGGLSVLWGIAIHKVSGYRQVLGETTVTVEERVAALERRVAVLEKRSGTTAKKGTTEQISFFRLTDGSATGIDWTPVTGSEFWLSQELYGNVKQISWEGWLSVTDGNGVAMARLYDITNNRAVDFSEVRVGGGTKASFYSQALAIWRGQNQYRIEVKSSTGYAVAISEARLRIVTQ